MSKIQFLDPREQEAFDSAGYFVRRVFDAQTAGQLAAEFEQLTAGMTLDSNYASNYFSLLDDDQIGLDALSEWTCSVWSKPMADVASGWKTVQGGITLKHPRGGPTVMHQHSPATDHPFSPNLVSWCPLADCGVSEGCLYLIPGSQHLFRHIDAGQNSYLTSAEIVDRIFRDHAVAVPLAAGEAVFFDNSLLHGAYANQTDRMRLAFGVLIASEDEALVTYSGSQDGIVALRMQGNNYAKVGMGTPDAKLAGGEVLRRFPNWSPHPNYAQIDALLRAKGPRASEDYDPLVTVSHLADAQPEQLSAPDNGPWQRVRQAAKRIPGAGLAYRSFRTLAGTGRSRHAARKG